MSVLNQQGALKKRTTEIFQSKKLSDCSFRVGLTVDNRQVFEAHKFMLSIASPVFEAMFYGKLPEEKYPIDVSDVEPQAFAILMSYIYTDEIKFATIEDAIATCYAAVKYMLTPVVDLCVVHVKNKLTVSNVCLAYEFADLYDKEDLTKCCIQLIKKNINSVLNDPGFLDININTLKDIFHMNDLEIDTELPLFTALERYANAKGLQKDVGKEYDVYREILKTIRFLSVTPKQFADGPANSKLLQQDEKFAIIMNISSDDVKNLPMPQGFSRNKSCRKLPSSGDVNNFPMPQGFSRNKSCRKLPSSGDVNYLPIDSRNAIEMRRSKKIHLQNLNF